MLMIKLPLRSICFPPAFLLIALMLSGCASTYTLPKSTEAFARLMTREQALAIISDASTADDKHAGLCSYRDVTLGISLSGYPARFTRVEDDRLHFTSSLQILTGNQAMTNVTRPQGPQMNVAYSNPDFPYEITLSKIDLIRVMGQNACGRQSTGKAFRLEKGMGASVLVHVDDERLERFAAALKHFAPAARWIEGFGF